MEELNFALGAVRWAAQLTMHVQNRMAGAALDKEDKTPVTEADYAAQAVVARLLQRTFPDSVLVAEENADLLRNQPEMLKLVTNQVRTCYPEATKESVCDWIDFGRGEPGQRFWTLDPVDGTKGFLRGAQYVTALALIEHGKVQLGVLGCPHLSMDGRIDPHGEGALLYARRGRGTRARPLVGDRKRTLHVSTLETPSSARVARSYESAHTDPTLMNQLLERLEIRTEPMRMDSQVKYGLVADGQADLLFRLVPSSNPDYQEKIWDHAAGSIVVESAGGRVTDLDGKPLDFGRGRTLKDNRGVLVSNGLLHNEALRAIRHTE